MLKLLVSLGISLVFVLCCVSCAKVGLWGHGKKPGEEISFKSGYSKVVRSMNSYLKKAGIPMKKRNLKKGVFISKWYKGKSRRFYYNYMEYKEYHDSQFSHFITIKPRRKGTFVRVITKEKINLVVEDDADEEVWVGTPVDTLKSYEIIYDLSRMLGENNLPRFSPAIIPDKPLWERKLFRLREKRKTY